MTQAGLQAQLQEQRLLGTTFTVTKLLLHGKVENIKSFVWQITQFMLS